jgi:hypothetical protein
VHDAVKFGFKGNVLGGDHAPDGFSEVLGPSLIPPELLRPGGTYHYGQFGGCFNVFQVLELPVLQLSPVAKIKVFG